MTFAELQTAVAGYLNRSDLSSMIPTWINIGQRKLENGTYYMENGVQHFHNNWKYMEVRATTSASEDDAYITLPTNFKQAIWVKVVDNTLASPVYYDLIPVSPQKALEDYPSIVGNKGRPKEFAVIKYSGEFLVRPTLDQAYTFDVYFYAYSTALSANTDSNWLSLNYPEILIYSALMEAEPYLENDARMATWKSMLNDSVAGLARSEKETNSDPNPAINVTVLV